MNTTWAAFVRRLLENNNRVLEEMVSGGLRTAANLARTPGAKMLLYDGNTLVEKASISPVRATHKNVRLDVGEGICGRAFRGRCPVSTPDLLKDDRLVWRSAAEAQCLRGYAAVPMMLGEEAVGVIAVHDLKRREFSRDLLGALHSWANAFTLALHHATCFPEFAPSYLEQITKIVSAPTRASGGIVGHSSEPNLGCGPESLPKGIQYATFRVVMAFLKRSQKPVSRKQVAEATGLTTVSARTYLNFLRDSGFLLEKKRPRGGMGRPEFLYSIDPRKRAEDLPEIIVREMEIQDSPNSDKDERQDSERVSSFPAWA